MLTESIFNIQEIAEPVLVVAAHPEDIEIHAGGMIAQLSAAGKRVAFVLCTSGNRGTSDPTMTMERLAEIREEEQKQAARILGVNEIIFLHHADGDLSDVHARLRAEIVRLIRQYRPASIITHDPFPGNGALDSCSIYPDHRCVGEITFEAAFVRAPGPLFHPEHLAEGLQTHKPSALYLIMSSQPDVFVDIGAAWETKMQAVHQYRSQGRDLPTVEPYFRNIAHALGARAGYALAEGFRRLVPS